MGEGWGVENCLVWGIQLKDRGDKRTEGTMIGRSESSEVGILKMLSLSSQGVAWQCETLGLLVCGRVADLTKVDKG